MSNAHSPAPWRWISERVDGGSDTRAYLVDADGESVMLAYNPADAALIAAAPELLALLREARDWLQDPSAYAQDSARSFDERVEALLARLPPAPEEK